MNRNILAAAVAVALLALLLFSIPECNEIIYSDDTGEKLTEFNVQRIAHAGGEVDGKRYTNSYEALDKNIKQGFVYFELDFSFTSDEELVCLHDWSDSFRRSFGYEVSEKVTLKEFEAIVKKKSEFSKCTLGGLGIWMKENPDAIIITDVKGSNYKALKMMKKVLPDAEIRVIPQIYDPVKFLQIKKLGYKQIIWTLYRYPGTSQEVLSWVSKFNGPVAITMPKDRGVTALPVELKNMGVPTYVHTINAEQEMNQFLKGYGVSEIYTDILNPMHY